MPNQSSAQHHRIDLTTFFLSVSSAAFIGLGVAPEKEGSEPRVDLDLARQNIDLLELMKDKTTGNRNPEEDKLLDQLLFETRMRFIEAQRRFNDSSKK